MQAALCVAPHLFNNLTRPSESSPTTGVSNLSSFVETFLFVFDKCWFQSTKIAWKKGSSEDRKNPTYLTKIFSRYIVSKRHQTVTFVLISVNIFLHNLAVCLRHIDFCSHTENTDKVQTHDRNWVKNQSSVFVCCLLC